MPTPAAIDISHHQTIPESLVPAKESGIAGVIHKATESTGYVDDKMAARHHLAREAGLAWGLYHFLRPGSMQAQADHFLAAAAPYMDEATLLAADHEDPGVSLDQLVEFLEAVEAKSGRSPVIYSGHVLKDQLAGKADPRLAGYRLWLAHYTSGAPTLPPGWAAYWLWQYTDKGNVPGINPPVDLDAYDGAVADMLTEWSGGEAMPEPPPLVRPTVVVTIAAPPGVNVEVKQV